MRKIGLVAKFINSSVNIFKLKTLSLPCLHEWKQSSLREVCVCLSSYWEVVIKWRNQRGTHPFPKFKWKHWCIKIRAQTLHHHLKIGIHGRNPAALVTFVGLDFVGPPYHHYYYVQSPPCSNASIHISSGGSRETGLNYARNWTKDYPNSSQTCSTWFALELISNFEGVCSTKVGV